MYHLRSTALFLLLVCLLFSLTPIQSTALDPGVVSKPNPEIKHNAENIVSSHALSNGGGPYALYEAKASLAKRASAKCVATSLLNKEDKCCTSGGACCYCDGCSAGGGDCSCPEDG